MTTKEYDQDEHAEQGADALAAFILCLVAIAYIFAKTIF